MSGTDDNSAVGGLMHLLRATNNGAADGTGIDVLVTQARNLLGNNIPPVLIDYTMGLQNNIFGSYPDKSDIAPSAVFLAVFAVIGIAHLVLFFINFSRGHYFYLSLIWTFYCILKVVGWALRVAWAKDITMVKLGIADEVLLILSSIILVAVNLILAQRLFTWRHPVGGSRRLFNYTMYLLYSVVAAVIAMTIVASAVPYTYLLSEHAYESYKNVVKVSAILIILYSLTAVSLIALSYFFKPTTKDENLYTYQPWWIESFHPFYFVRPHAAQEAEESFMKRNHNHRHAIRVIAATHHHYNMVEGLTNQRGTLAHNKSLGIILFTTLAIFVGAIVRAVAVFQARFNRDSGPACNPIAAYMCWGVLEVLVNLLYLIGRVDLRFYRPDVLPAKIRAIITAEQTYYPSDNESDEITSSTSETDYYNEQKPSNNAFHFENQRSQNAGAHPYNNLTSQRFPNEKAPGYPTEKYPKEKFMSDDFDDDEKLDFNDNDSDFYF